MELDDDVNSEVKITIQHVTSKQFMYSKKDQSCTVVPSNNQKIGANEHHMYGFHIIQISIPYFLWSYTSNGIVIPCYLALSLLRVIYRCEFPLPYICTEIYFESCIV